MRGIHAQRVEVARDVRGADATAEHDRRGRIADRDHPLHGFGHAERFTYTQLHRAQVVAARLVRDDQLFAQREPGVEHGVQHGQFEEAGRLHLAVAFKDRAVAAA